MNVIQNIFDRMDKWRNLPNYQLERRADLFFAVYLKLVLEHKFGTKLREDLIPEFPVRIGTIYPNIDINKSLKIDYVAIAKDYSEAIFIELKTDSASRREDQDRYLRAAASLGFTELIEGLIKVFQATNYKKKYFHLFKLLEDMKIVKLPEGLERKVFSGNMTGINSLISEIVVVKMVEHNRIVYVQPTGHGEDIINFKEFAESIQTFKDPVTSRFIQSLTKWHETKAGSAGI